MSKFAMLLMTALLGALALSSTASAGVSKYCTLLSSRDIARPLGISGVSTSSVSVAYPSQTKAKGKITLCSHKAGSDLTAESSVSKFTKASGAKAEFKVLLKQEHSLGHVSAVKMSGPWAAGYFLQSDGFVALKGKYMFHIQYATAAPGYSRIKAKTLAALAAKAVRKL